MKDVREIETGCIIDSNTGWRAHVDMVEYAASKGFPMDEEDKETLSAYKDQSADDGDAMLSQGGLMDRAEKWLNKNIAKEGCSFGWSAECGGFFYMTEEWWQEG